MNLADSDRSLNFERLCLITAAVTVVLLVFSAAIQSLLLILALSLLLALTLEPAVAYLQIRGVSKSQSNVALGGSLLVFVALFAGLFGPRWATEIQEMRTLVLGSDGNGLVLTLQSHLGFSVPVLGSEALQGGLQQNMQAFLQKSFAFAGSVTPALIACFVIATAAYLLVKDGDQIRRRFLERIPNRYFELSVIVLHKTASQLRRYLFREMPLALLVWALVSLSLLLLDVRFPLVLGGVAGAAYVIPYFGQVVGIIPALIVVLMDSGSLGGIVVIIVAFASIQLLINLILNKVPSQKTAELQPLTVLLLLAFGALAFGVPGILFATPLAVMAKIAFGNCMGGLKSFGII